MFKLHESQESYRFGDSGPKYLMKGPRSNFALVRLKPGEDFKAHYHGVMEENFYIMEGEVDIVVDGVTNSLGAGDFIHLEPGETHYLVNRSNEAVRLVATLAPYQESDKFEVD